MGECMNAGPSLTALPSRTPVGDSLKRAVELGSLWSPAYHAQYFPDAASDLIEIAASELAALIADAGRDSGGAAPRGINVEGLMVRGRLDLSRISFEKSIVMHNCLFDGGIDASHARFGALDLSECQFPWFSAPEAWVAGDLTLDRSLQTDWIDLQEARIGGRLSLAGSRLNPEAKVHECAAGIRNIRERTDQTLHCYGMRVDAAVWLSDGFVAHGEISLCAATIGRDVICNGGQFLNPTGYSIFAAGSQIGFIVSLVRAKAEGEINFAGTNIGGNVICRASSFTTDFDDRSAFYDLGFPRAALNMQNACIGGLLILLNQKSPISSLNLASARAGAFSDDRSAWPEKGKLELDGFVYDRLIGFPGVGDWEAKTPLDHESRKEWLDRQASSGTEFKLQPWTQCAKALMDIGRAHDARMILYERERRWLRSKQQHPVTRWFHRFVLGPLSGYGYRNHYALFWALAIWLTGAVVFAMANDLGMMRPASEHVLLEHEYRQTGHPPPDYEPIDPLFYSADLLLPIVDIGQERYWIPRNAGERPVNAAKAYPFLPAAAARAVDTLVGGILPKAYYYFEIAMGWLLVSIAIAGFSKLIGHPQQE